MSTQLRGILWGGLDGLSAMPERNDRKIDTQIEFLGCIKHFIGMIIQSTATTPTRMFARRGSGGADVVGV